MRNEHYPVLDNKSLPDIGSAHLQIIPDIAPYQIIKRRVYIELSFYIAYNGQAQSNRDNDPQHEFNSAPPGYSVSEQIPEDYKRRKSSDRKEVQLKRQKQKDKAKYRITRFPGF